MPGKPDRSLASMGIYIFNARYLYRELERDMADPDSSHDFGKDIIPACRASRPAVAAAHPFELELSCREQARAEEPYWRDVGTIDAYWDANIDLTATDPQLNLYDTRWPIWTYQAQLPPAKFVHNQDDRRGMAVESMVSGGCIVSGNVFRSVLFSQRSRAFAQPRVNWSVLAARGAGRARRARVTRADRRPRLPHSRTTWSSAKTAEADARALLTAARTGITLVTKRMLTALVQLNGQVWRTMKVLHVACAEIISHWSRPAAWPTWWRALPQALANARVPMCGCCCPGCRPSLRPCIRDQTRTVMRDRCLRSEPLRVTAEAWRACPPSGCRSIVIDAPYLYDRGWQPVPGRATASEWPDNLQRFALLGWVAAHIAAGDAGPAIVAARRIVHAHDWHAAMSCAFMSRAHVHGNTVASVYTVHNLAYQGLFAMHDWPLLGLASRLMSPTGLEFHGQLSFMKAGLQFADQVTTVSPSYAREIASHEFGCGLDGVIRGRGIGVGGILNGIDEVVWNPATDAALAACYDRERMAGKQACRRALQAELGLDADERALLITLVSRFTAQKGLDLVLTALPELMQAGVQLALQGSGDAALETAFRMAQQAHPGRVHVHLGYDEARAHRLIAGGDVIAVPSRFEPCGLTQMYGLRYGTLPLVRRVGGLADTVADADAAQLAAGTATGFVFDAATPTALARCVRRAIEVRAVPGAWAALVNAAMGQELSWRGPAQQYLALYERLCSARQLAGSSP